MPTPRNSPDGHERPTELDSSAGPVREKVYGKTSLALA
jgi:hypothetical protein